MASTVDGYIGKVDPGNGTNYAIGSTAYGVCETAANVAAKAVEMTGFTLATGATIHVKFTYNNTASSPTLNVNGTGAIAIAQYGSTAAGVTAETTGWQAGAVVCLTYDGARWVRDQGYNTNTNTDTYVTQTVRTTNGEFPVLLRGSTAGTTTMTGSTSFASSVTVNPSTGAMTAKTFSGSLAADNLTGTVSLEHGGTGAATAAAARTNLGIGNVNNTSDADKPVSTATQTALDGKSDTGHKHAAGDITSGTLGVARGGTGKATHTANAVLTGNGTSAVNNVATASGALYATAANGAAKFGTLPAAQGGTGQTSLQATRNAMGLGNTTGALPVANGGTGATTGADALSNLGINMVIASTGGTDLDTYTSAGVYCFPNSATAPSNPPIGSNGYLVVLRSGSSEAWIKQFWFRCGTIATSESAIKNDFQAYTRTSNDSGNSWGIWDKIGIGNTLVFQGAIPANTDANTLSRMGSYYVNASNASSIANSAYNNAHYLFTFAGDDSPYRILQIATMTNVANNSEPYGNELRYRAFNLETSIYGRWKTLSTEVPNPNLLDNWYFGNPVNQRGQTTYSSAGYTVDMWLINNSTITLNANSISFTGTSGSSSFYQRIDRKYTDFAGKIITITVLLADNTLGSISGSIANDKPTSETWQISKTFSTFWVGFKFVNAGYWTFTITTSTTIQIVAVKLELGDTQTLAHKDSSENWVLNEIPNYGEQLARCQRYQQVLNGESVRAFCVGTSSIFFFIPLPVTMRTTPKLGGSGSLTVANQYGGSVVSGFTFTLTGNNSGIYVTASKTSHGLQDAFLRTQNGTVLLDANL